MDVHEQRRKALLVLHQLGGRLAEQAAQLGLGPTAAATRNSSSGCSGRRGVAPAPERLVAGHRAARQAHDRLEQHRHLPALEQLRQLAHALHELLGQPHVSERDSGRLEPGHLRLVELLAADAELHLREVHDVALADPGLADALAVDEGAVLAAEVANPERPVPQLDLRVLLRDRLGGEVQREPLEPTDAEGERVDGDASQLASALDQALQVGRGGPFAGKGIILRL